MSNNAFNRKIKPKRPNQDLEWIGDAALTTGLRQVLVNRFPSVRYSALAAVVCFLSTNKFLEEYARKHWNESASDLEVRLGQMWNGGYVAQILFICRGLLDFKPIITDLLSQYESASDSERSMLDYRLKLHCTIDKR